MDFRILLKEGCDHHGTESKQPLAETIVPAKRSALLAAGSSRNRIAMRVVTLQLQRRIVAILQKAHQCCRAAPLAILKPEITKSTILFALLVVQPFGSSKLWVRNLVVPVGHPYMKCARVCVRACVHACVCVRACVRACVCVGVC